MTFDFDDIDFELDSSEEEQELEPARSFEPFDIVLVDIQKAVTTRKIHCVKKRLTLDVDLKYVAISYRWGELAEDLVATADYNAHITSFNIKHFMDLCLAISKEDDFRTMKYLWVDAICVDQLNESRRKETIYHMNEIYEYSNWILAVPDLNLDYWMKSPLDKAAIDFISDNADYVYHIIMDKGDCVEEMDDRWMEEELKVPKHLRCHLRSQYTKPARALYQPPDKQDEIKQEDREKILYEELMLTELQELEQNESDGVPNTRLISRLIYEWQRAADDRYQNLERVVDFLVHRGSDWSERTWVISEYSIAKTKNNGIIKYWFVSLSNHIRTDKPHADFKFFEADTRAFGTTSTRRLSQINATRSLPFSIDSLKLGSHFRDRFNSLTSLSMFLEMLLESKASKNTDRFYAILPLSEKYRHHIKNKDTIKNWGITDMVSVRMRVRQWLTVKENLKLLYESDGPDSLLPSFDTRKVKLPPETVEPIFNRYIYRDPFQYNFNLGHTEAGVVIRDKIDKDVLTRDPLRYSMLLYPKLYLAQTIAFRKETTICDRVWCDLGLIPSVGPLTWLRVPLFILCDEFLGRENISDHVPPSTDKSRLFKPNHMLSLIGSRSKNVWIVIRGTSELLTEEYIRALDDWVWCHGGDREPGICVY